MRPLGGRHACGGGTCPARCPGGDAGPWRRFGPAEFRRGSSTVCGCRAASGWKSGDTNLPPPGTRPPHGVPAFRAGQAAGMQRRAPMPACNRRQEPLSDRPARRPVAACLRGVRLPCTRCPGPAKGHADGCPHCGEDGCGWETSGDTNLSPPVVPDRLMVSPRISRCLFL